MKLGDYAALVLMSGYLIVPPNQSVFKAPTKVLRIASTAEPHQSQVEWVLIIPPFSFDTPDELQPHAPLLFGTT